MTYVPLKFINEEIEALYRIPPTLEKKPGCPDGFVWRNDKYVVDELISEWHVYQRKGRMARNMKPCNTPLGSPSPQTIRTAIFSSGTAGHIVTAETTSPNTIIPNIHFALFKSFIFRKKYSIHMVSTLQYHG